MLKLFMIWDSRSGVTGPFSFEDLKNKKATLGRDGYAMLLTGMQSTDTHEPICSNHIVQIDSIADICPYCALEQDNLIYPIVENDKIICEGCDRVLSSTGFIITAYVGTDPGEGFVFCWKNTIGEEHEMSIFDMQPFIQSISIKGLLFTDSHLLIPSMPEGVPFDLSQAMNGVPFGVRGLMARTFHMIPEEFEAEKPLLVIFEDGSQQTFTAKGEQNNVYPVKDLCLQMYPHKPKREGAKQWITICPLAGDYMQYSTEEAALSGLIRDKEICLELMYDAEGKLIYHTVIL